MSSPRAPWELKHVDVDAGLAVELAGRTQEARERSPNARAGGVEEKPDFSLGGQKKKDIYIQKLQAGCTSVAKFCGS